MVKGKLDRPFTYEICCRDCLQPRMSLNELAVYVESAQAATFVLRLRCPNCGKECQIKLVELLAQCHVEEPDEVEEEFPEREKETEEEVEA